MTAPVAIDARERRARPWLPATAHAWTFHVGPTGEAVRVNVDGSVTAVLIGGMPRAGAASDPCNVRGRERRP